MASIKGLPEAGSEYHAIVLLVAGGADASTMHITWGGTLMPADEGTFFEITDYCRRYHAAFCRTINLGTPPYLEAEKALLECIETGLEVTRPENGRWILPMPLWLS